MKLLWIFRAIFLVVVVAVMFVNISSPTMEKNEDNEPSSEVYRTNVSAIIWSTLGMTVFVFLLDVLTPKKKLTALAGVFFGLLVGILISWALANVVDMIMETFGIRITEPASTAIKWTLGVCVCYLVISIVMRTKDDVRFVIPYVEFGSGHFGNH
jgi:xanthine/uracil permease